MSVSAALLAGGESRRMGADKSQLVIAGTPLWRRQLELLKAIGPVEVLVSAKTDPAWRPADNRFVGDEPPSRGPLSGIAAAMNAMRDTHLLVLAIDMPLMKSCHLASLCDLVVPGRGVIPKIGGQAEPLAAIYPRECLPHLLIALRGRDFSLQRLVVKLAQADLLHTFAVPKSEQHFYRSINAPTDLLICSGLKQDLPLTGR